MPTYRIERTEQHTRVWMVEAATAEDALADYLDQEDDEEHGYHSGDPVIVIEEVEATAVV